ncbi:MAG: MarR family transcriptional regulator [Intrasporangium sp.]|uniref:MarR family winged helix-turn-helix transcriptional regulator n=1 Tax=Intrasporangium sp. TaxID=1925024 RepID=UPI0026473E57|nr:MarR family transcriptional regulator [Intrasporangium sp.]MDN5797430.1 MarR family transcriptional regulator [Intrasporangium sp.]
MGGHDERETRADPLSGDEIAMLFTFRRAMLQYTKWSERRVRKAGLTPQQYLLLLAVRARDDDSPPSVGDLAGELLIRPNSAIELVNRAESLGLVARQRDDHDQRVVRVTLTDKADGLLGVLATAHLAELERAAETLSISEEFLATLSAKFLGAGA